jgi:predicted dehydrogenase
MAAATVFSRDAGKARAFAARFGAERGTDDLAEALEGVDAAYVATPVPLHAPHARAAIAAGVPVLVEKPFAMSAPEARDLAEAARQAGVFCMEAVWTRFLPVIAAARDALGGVGEIRAFDAGFETATAFDPAISLFDPARGGGALMQRGAYAVSLARALCGPVEEVRALGHLAPTGVDAQAAVILRHASGAVSSLRASLVAQGANRAALAGTRGTIHLDAPLWRPRGGRLVPTTAWPQASGAPRRLEGLRESGAGQRLADLRAGLRAGLRREGRALPAGFDGNGYVHEARALRDAVRDGLAEHPAMPLAESVEAMEVLDEARAQIGARIGGAA